MEHRVPHLHCSLEEFASTLKDVTRLTMLSLFWEVNAMGIVLKEDDQTNLKYLTVAMAASETYGKSTCAIRFGFLMRGMAVGVNVVEAFLSYWLCWYVLSSGSEVGLNHYLFPLGILIAGWCSSCWHDGTSAR